MKDIELIQAWESLEGTIKESIKILKSKDPIVYATEIKALEEQLSIYKEYFKALHDIKNVLTNKNTIS